MISTDTIDRLHSAAMANGAMAGKISGAGGGGYMLFIAEEMKEAKLFEFLRNAGLNPEPIKFDDAGVVKWRM
jgi:D-glycero-alpha-D-manno-heptose-7-phosphate kinase